MARAEADRRLEPRPVVFTAATTRQPRRAARRRRARHRAAEPRRAPRRDLDRERDDATRIASSSTRPAARRSRRRARDGSPYRLRLVAHDAAAYDCYYNVVANPTLWFIQHYLWDARRTRRTSTRRSTTPGTRATSPVNRAFADAVLAELEREPDAAVFFHDYHLYLAPRLRARARPDAALAHFVHIPWPEPDYWRVLPEPIAARDPRRPARERRGRLPHRPLAAQLPALERDSSAPTATSSELVATTAAGPSSPRARSRSIRRSSTSWPRASAVLAAERGARGARGRRSSSLRVDRTDPSKNIVRGFRAFELYLDAHPEMHGRVGMLALLDPSRQDIPEYAEYLGAIQRAARARQRSLPARRLDADRPADRGQLPAVGRGVQAVRRAARERDLRRDEPRREGGAAREPARRRADPVRERRRARGARRVGAVRQPVRRRGAGRGDPRRRSRCRARSGARGSRRSASTCASTTSPRGSRRSSTTSTGWCDAGRRTVRRALPRRRDGRRAHGRRRRQGRLAPARGRARDACGWRRRRRGGCASCRRATRSRPRSWRGSWPRSGRAS